MPPSTGPSWRGPASKPPTGNSLSWRRPGRGTPMPWNPKSKWLKTLMSGLSALTAVALFPLYVYVVMFVPSCSQTEFMAVAPAPYSDSSMPSQPFAKEDADTFREQFKVKNLTALNSLVPKQKSSRSYGNSSRSTRIIYITALAGQLENGVILYDKGAGPDHNEVNDYLPLKQLWDFLSEMPSEQTKLLVIDIARGPIDWRWGQFARPYLGSVSEKGDVTGIVADELARIPNLAIMTSVAPGEVSWTSPKFRQSVFGFFLVQGLAGKADDKAEGGNDDHRISLEELYNFVLTHTNHWVEQNRDPRGQHPQLLLSPDHRALKTAFIANRSRTATSETATTKPIEGGDLDGRLDKLWEEYDKWSEKEAAQWHPLAWHQLLENVRRADQLKLNGQPEAMGVHLDAATKAVDALENSVKALDDPLDIRMRYFTNGISGLSRRDLSGVFSKQALTKPEAHLPQMFGKFLPQELQSSPDFQQDVKKSNVLRGIAEELSWNSFRSRLWTSSALIEADRERRNAEDLLFVGGQIERKDFTRRQSKANDRFTNVQQIAKDLSELIHLHNRLLAELPELAWWAAQRIPNEILSKPPSESKRFQMIRKFLNLIDSDESRPKILRDYEVEFADFINDRAKDNEYQSIEAELLVLFEQARELGRLLDQERDKLAQPFALSEDWKSKRDIVYDHGDRLVAVTRRLRQSVDDLTGGRAAGIEATGEGQVQSYQWLKLRNALQWSGLNKAQKIGLFKAIEDCDRILEEKSRKQSDIKSAKWSEEDWSNVDGSWQAMWALQTLSLGTSTREMDDRWNDWKKIRLGQGNELAKLGAQVRKKFLSQVVEAKKTPSEADQLDDAMISFLKSERAVRTLHGHDATSFNLEHDPIPRMHTFDLGALCVMQADRYLEDFWGNPVGNNLWYVEAVDQCLRAAGRQDDLIGIQALKKARSRVETRFSEQRKASLRISKVPDKSVDLTLSDKGETTLESSIDDRIPSGFAALELLEDVDPALKILEFMPNGRQAIEHKMSANETVMTRFEIQKRIPPDSGGTCEEIHLQPRLLFRGRYWDSDDQQVLVDPCRPNPIIGEYRVAPKTGEIVVNGVDRRDTIFMLDCSLSMNELKPDSKDRRFDVATKALSNVLERLFNEPVPTNVKANERYVVGLAALGHRLRSGEHLPGVKERNRNDTENNVLWDRDILDFEKNVNLGVGFRNTANWKKDCELLAKPLALDDTQLKKMNAYLGKGKVPDLENPGKLIPRLGPFGDTPLLNSIFSAGKYLINKREGGLVIVVCDGAFNDEAANGAFYNQLVAHYTLNKDKLLLHLIAFDIDPHAEKQSLESLNTLAKAAGGRFHEAATVQTLDEVAKKAMKPRKFRVIRNAEPLREEDLNNPVQRLGPDTYSVKFEGIPDFPATISGGERIVFDLDNRNSQLLHHRPDLKNPIDIRGNRKTAPNEPTKFGYLKSEFDDTTNVATIQIGLDTNDPAGTVDRPNEVRFDISPIGAASRRKSVSWNLLPNQSTPVWEIRLIDWPARKFKPEIRAFWKMTRTEPGWQLPLQEVFSMKQLPVIDDWPAGSLIVTAEKQGGKVLVKLEAIKPPKKSNVADFRVELGEVSQVLKRFEPIDFNYSNEFFEKQNQIIYSFDVGNTIDLTKFRIALTSVKSLLPDPGEIPLPLAIEKWDDELQ